MQLLLIQLLLCQLAHFDCSILIFRFDSTLAKLEPYTGQKVVLHALDECAITDELLSVYERPDLDRYETILSHSNPCDCQDYGSLHSDRRLNF